MGKNQSVTDWIWAGEGVVVDGTANNNFHDPQENDFYIEMG